MNLAVVTQADINNSTQSLLKFSPESAWQSQMLGILKIPWAKTEKPQIPKVFGKEDLFTPFSHFTTSLAGLPGRPISVL